ncbi:hypothetical protein EYZ11_007731 [Aspergillus tanneri]|uniref:Uncharacterized protein n=1 Tax=Aspergillus tanneri TaxID=1220188 RepID=A0A4S3JCK5_9EURO|nr:hypothetical protein EYZ11_007731 [Aspergillus tanneri]
MAPDLSETGTVEYVPVHFMHKSLDFTELVALYAVSDICIVTSTRDGMNLVALEYIAARSGNPGTLILSEFAGTAQSLPGSLLVNPWDTEQVAEAFSTALAMDQSTQESNFCFLHQYVSKHTW